MRHDGPAMVQVPVGYEDVRDVQNLWGCLEFCKGDMYVP